MTDSGSTVTAGFNVIAQMRLEDSLRFEVAVLDDCPPCRDHFPGDPMVPAIAQIDLVISLRKLADQRSELEAINILRLRTPVRPGDRITVHLRDPDSNRKSRFTIRCGERLQTEGTLLWNRSGAE